MTTPAQHSKITSLVEQLAEPYEHVEPIHSRDKHRNRRMRFVHAVMMPGLLAQLEERFEPGSVAADTFTAAPSYGSRPPVALDCLSVHTQITIAVARWLWALQIPQRDTVQANLRALVGARMSDDLAHNLIEHLDGWVRLCRVITRWSTPAYQPHGARCPVASCRRKSTLRINLSARSALCTTCGSTWDADGIEALATAISLEAA
jgi:hypothetical protein